MAASALGARANAALRGKLEFDDTYVHPSFHVISASSTCYQVILTIFNALYSGIQK
jgi:hypothetical protein